ncbi:OsmC family protein [Citricoccus sp. SGAir0253]|uniref:OsmC family protein n=1 Tax=Citricoccus sp. SGAir0253 TaxID=2567881 RepID=UPI00143DBEC1|nr:OsmC family protein [Citricoccus sp. SGAir0253]
MQPRFTETPVDSESKTLRAAGTWTGRQQTRVAIRGFAFTVDEPEAIGGRDEAPTPMEYLAGAVDACITVTIDQAAARRGLGLTGISTYSLARQDRRGLAGTADVQPYFHAYRLQVCVGTPETDPAVLRDFAAAVEHSCPAVNLLRDANVDLTVAWSFAARTVAHDAEAACNLALGYPVPNAPVGAPEPVFTCEDADVRRGPDGGAPAGRAGAPGTAGAADAGTAGAADARVRA